MADPAPRATSAEPAASPPAADPAATIRSRQFLVLLVLAAIVGVIASIAAWGFLQLIHQIQVGVFTDLPKDLGLDGVPNWWYLPWLAIAGVIAAFAISKLPGTGGHTPAGGLNPSPTQPIELPGVILAALASIGLGVVLGPEAPLIALGGGLGALCVRAIRRDAPPQLTQMLAVAGTFAAVSFLFGSPLIAAVLLIEATGLGGPQRNVIILPGLLAAGVGSLVSIGMGSFTGLSTSAISIGVLHLPTFTRPGWGEFGWTIALSLAIAVGVAVIFHLARATVKVATPRPFLVLPVVGLAVAGLAIAFSEASGKSAQEVLFSGQDQLPGLVASPDSWTLWALAGVIAFKGIAYGISLGSFRGGPAFPAMFLGSAAGMMAAHLPGFSLTPGVAVGLAAAVVAVLRLPLSAIVLSMVLTSKAGIDAVPLIVVGTVVAYVAVLALDTVLGPRDAAAGEGAGAPAPAQESSSPSS
ncbi:MAG: chloride channel protein [Solirubrobacteraceae bacterium]